MRGRILGPIALLFLTFSAYPTLSQSDTRENPLQANGPNGPLEGVYAQPSQIDAPVALIIPGSGPIDRDGNGGPALRTNTYRLIAKGLADHNIATVRIDKRGLFGSRSATKNPDDVTLNAYGDDVDSWISTIRQELGASCVWLLGHSEGGLVAINYAANNAQHLCGLLLVAVPGRPIAELVREQLNANPANEPILREAFSIVAKLEGGERVNVTTYHPALKILFRESVQGYWLDLFSFDAPQKLAQYNGPVLVLQGSLDLQVKEIDAEILHKSASQSRLLKLKNGNHILKKMETSKKSENLSSYANPDLPLHPALISALASFIKANQ